MSYVTMDDASGMHVQSPKHQLSPEQSAPCSEVSLASHQPQLSCDSPKSAGRTESLCKEVAVRVGRVGTMSPPRFEQF